MTESSSPLISVCLTTYMHKDYIGQCIESVLAQECNFPYEILIGDDGSTDGTFEICQQYAEKYPGKFRLFQRSRADVIYINGNATGRFNFTETVKAAKGKYIALCDGDDYWCDTAKLQKQVDLLESHPGCVVCHHWQRVAAPGEDGKFMEKPAPRDGHGYFPQRISSVAEIFRNKLRIKSRTVMFRNIFRDGEVLPEWFYQIAFGDVALSMILGKHGDFLFIDEEMAVYRITGGGLSTKGNKDPLFTLKHYLAWIRIWEEGDQFHQEKYHKEAFTTICYFYKYIFAAYNCSKPIFRKARKYALFASAYGFWPRIFTALKVGKIYREALKEKKKS